jgi:hypothetical protein
MIELGIERKFVHPTAADRREAGRVCSNAEEGGDAQSKVAYG